MSFTNLSLFVLLAAQAESSTSAPSILDRLQRAVTAVPGRGITIANDEGTFSMNILGRVMPRETLTVSDGTYKNELNIRTARLNVSGYAFTKELRYQIQIAFAGADFERDTGSPSPLLDAWVEYAPFRDLAIRAGQAFVQFDRARTTREFALQLVDRQIAVNELNLDRDIGIQISSNDFLGTGMLSYFLGVYSGEGRNRVGSTRPGFLYAGRLSFRPFGPFDDGIEGDLERLDRVRLAIGGGAAFNHRTDRPRSTTGVPFSESTFDYFHAAGDLVFKWNGFSFFAEVLYRDSKVDEKNGEFSRSAWGYFVQSGMMLTDSIEIAARWGEIIAIGDTDPALIKMVDTQGRELGGGISLYLDGHRLKIQADYFHLFGVDIGEGRDVARLQLNALL